MGVNVETGVYLLDSNAISEVFRSYYPTTFPSFWRRFDALVEERAVVSVRAVRAELERFSRVPGAVQYLERLNSRFFEFPNDQEQLLVARMLEDPNLSDASNRWHGKSDVGNEDADPFLIAKARSAGAMQVVPITVVTLESPANPGSIPSVCELFGTPCIDLETMMQQLGWEF